MLARVTSRAGRETGQWAGRRGLSRQSHIMTQGATVRRRGALSVCKRHTKRHTGGPGLAAIKQTPPARGKLRTPSAVCSCPPTCTWLHSTWAPQNRLSPSHGVFGAAHLVWLAGILHYSIDTPSTGRLVGSSEIRWGASHMGLSPRGSRRGRDGGRPGVVWMASTATWILSRGRLGGAKYKAGPNACNSPQLAQTGAARGRTRRDRIRTCLPVSGQR